MAILRGLCAVAVLLACAAPALGDTVTGPVRPGTRPNAFHASPENLASRGYQELEFFIEGTVDGKATPDAASAAKPYKTRLLVRRPADPAKFNGTVVVEWQNVTLGYDFEVGWPMFSDLIMREGYAWVGVTAQPVGLHFLQQWDPARYGSLAHPGLPEVMPRAGESGFVVISGETYSDAIFRQVGRTLRSPGAVDPLGGLKPQRLLAYGLSQSAGRLTTYINNLARGDRVYDGYYLHVGPGRVRDDLEVPVFGLNSENEVLRYYQIRRPDSPLYRYWEVAGSGHVPRLADDILTAQVQRDGAPWPRKCDFGPAVVSIEYVSRAVLHHLNEWVKTGKQPPSAPFMDVQPAKAASGEAAQPAITRDKHLNAVGGIRLPHIEVPTGRHVGTGTPANCRLTPGYAPFDAATLAALYPTRDAYLSRVKSVAADAVKAGFLLPSDAKAIEAEAAAAAAKELKVSGLKQPVEVYRDGYGTPHLFARDNDDLFVAFGYLTAEDRLFQLDYSRRAMSGRIAEIRGADFLESDRYFRTLGLRPLAESVAAKSEPVTRRVLERFSQGVNAYIASHRDNLPVEFQRLGYAPEPWTPADSVLIWKMFGNVLDLSKWRGQVARARLVEKFGDRAKELFPGPDTSATIVQPGEMRASPRTQTTARSGGFLRHESTEGSNDWVVAAKKSVTGMPILAADPHLPVTAPAVWYEVHLKGGDYDVAGIAMAGTPFVFMGNNARIAFAYTYSTINVTDVYEERLNPANQEQYEYLGRWEPVRTRREVINVKGRSPVTLDVRSTRHGPLVSEFTQAGGKHYAVRWSDYDVQANEMHALRLINLAANWSDFKEGVRHYNTLSGNFLYGDVDGNIGYHTGAAVPIRRKGDGAMAVPGWTDEYEWNGYVPFDELPQVYNPERGWIATANNTIAGSWYPYFLSNPGNTRAERIHEVLQSKERFAIEDFKALQSDVRSTQPRRVLPLLLAAFEGKHVAPEVAAALERVRHWKDAEFDRKAVAPTIYDAFYRRLSENVFLDEAGGDREMYRTLFGNASFTSLMFEQPNSPWFDDIATPARETRDDVLVRSLEQGVAELAKQFGADQDEWRWERRNLVPMPHMTVLGTQFGALFPDFSLGPFAKPGRSGWTVDPSGGNQYRMIVDLSNLDNSISALGPGISGNPSSPHYKDQLPFWTEGTYHPKYFSREKAIASARTRVLLIP